MRRIASYLFAFFTIFLATAVLQAGVYNAITPAPALATGGTILVWDTETPTPGNGTSAASQQVRLQRIANVNGTPFSVDGKFSGAPGVFEVDVQVASNDSDTDFQTCNGCNITTVDSTNNTFHLDAGLAATRYVRLLMRSRSNSVTITARVSR